VRGFRAWFAAAPPRDFKKCGCGWSGLPHYSADPEYKSETAYVEAEAVTVEGLGVAELAGLFIYSSGLPSGSGSLASVRQIRERPRNTPGFAIYAAFTKTPGGWQRTPGRRAHHQKFNVTALIPLLREPVENSDNSELRRISCFLSHSGHRAVLHRSCSETLRV